MNDDIVVQATLETVLNTAQLSWVTPPVLTMSYTSSVSDESWCRPHHVIYDILKQSSEVKKSKWTWFSFWRQLNLMKESPIKMQMLLWIKSHLRIFHSNPISISFRGSLVIEIWKLFINRFKAVTIPTKRASMYDEREFNLCICVKSEILSQYWQVLRMLLWKGRMDVANS